MQSFRTDSSGKFIDYFGYEPGLCCRIIGLKLWGKTLVDGKLRSRDWWERRKESCKNKEVIYLPEIKGAFTEFAAPPRWEDEYGEFRIMTKLEKTFGIRKILFPVIHVSNEDQALKNCEIAVNAGCKGVFLINHSIRHTKLFKIVELVSQRFPLWLGVNALDLSPLECIQNAPTCVKGVWTDNAGFVETNETHPYMISVENIKNATVINDELEKRKDIIYFGGVAFKYQEPVKDLEFVSEIAKNYMDVVTTSGDGTGIAADIKKVSDMKNYIKDTSLGIASGITIENVDQYLPYVDAFLVATGISKTFTELDADKVKSLRLKIEA